MSTTFNTSRVISVKIMVEGEEYDELNIAEIDEQNVEEFMSDFIPKMIELSDHAETRVNALDAKSDFSAVLKEFFENDDWHRF